MTNFFSLIRVSSKITFPTYHQLSITQKYHLYGKCLNFAVCHPSESINDDGVENNNSYKDSSEQTISLLDFAGKCGYYNFYPTYFNQRSFFILVIDLTKSLDSVVEDTGGEGTSFEQWTYKGRILLIM